jgi:hypothetical protein
MITPNFDFSKLESGLVYMAYASDYRLYPTTWHSLRELSSYLGKGFTPMTLSRICNKDRTILYKGTPMYIVINDTWASSPERKTLKLKNFSNRAYIVVDKSITKHKAIYVPSQISLGA